uniref:Uncharacterized protein n=1 Tax=Oncorhynchus mykiss TaxID=8022 RepID=A0A8C7U810_ONCMY
MSDEGAMASGEGATASEEGEGATASEEGEGESDEALSNGSPIPPKRGRGRPKGSGSKKPKILRVLDKQPRGRPRKVVDPNAVSAETTAPLKLKGTWAEQTERVSVASCKMFF